MLNHGRRKATPTKLATTYAGDRSFVDAAKQPLVDAEHKPQFNGEPMHSAVNKVAFRLLGQAATTEQST